ncbi:MAG TPA: ATP-binding protein [Pyrinomonadaceae bacterium]
MFKNFIEDALHKPLDYTAYHVGRELAKLHPGKAIVEARAFYFDFDSFAAADQCAVVEHKSVFHHVLTEWDGIGESKRHIENSWLNVLWKGQLLDVILITWSEGCHRSRHHWIIGDDKGVAEGFYNAVCEWSCEVRGEILVYQDGGFEKDKQLFQAIKDATFDNLVLPASLKHQILDDFKQFFASREVYERYQIPWKRGAIFVGPPGNGKTHTLKALINELEKPCLYVRSFKSEYGTEQENMADVFQHARIKPPCLIVLEDLDSMIDDKNRSFLLNELDGFHDNTGVVVLATTNHPEKLDPAILDRPSRFDRKYYFQLPAEAERLAYIAKWNERLQPDLRVSTAGAQGAVSKTEGFSFAYLKELCVSSMVQWMSSGRQQSMDEVIASQAELLRGQMKS